MFFTFVLLIRCFLTCFVDLVACFVNLDVFLYTLFLLDLLTIYLAVCFVDPVVCLLTCLL